MLGPLRAFCDDDDEWCEALNKGFRMLSMITFVWQEP
jgi:hypothetical protein